MFPAQLKFPTMERLRPPKALGPAFLLSVAVHVYAGGWLYSTWHTPHIDPPQPLYVTLEAVPRPVVRAAPPQVAHERQKAPAQPQPQPSLPQFATHHAPMPATITTERQDPAPPVVASAAETQPAPTGVAVAPAAASAPTRTLAIEPPHFDVAYLNNPRPAYPPQARRLGLEGLVVLRVQVSAQGIPEQVVLAQTSGAPLLDEAAQKAVQGWKFLPARRGDTPIAHLVDVPVRFQLRN